ncbi:MAG: hypothetical protein QOG58_4057 [Caballeronia sp.]|jgi:hypothetical protein|nr:hypothetical protein [Caballeronia sp.]
MTWITRAGWSALVLAVAGGVMTVVIVMRHPGHDTAPHEEAPAFEPKTAAYYVAHRDEMRAREAECNNKGISPLADTPDARDCLAAANAERQIFFGTGK